MFCGNCGKEIEDNARFCPYCGYHLVMEQEKISDIIKQEETLIKEDKNINRKKWIIIIAVIIGIIIIIGTVVFGGVMALQKTNKKSEKNEEQKIAEMKEKVEEIEETEETEESETLQTEEDIQDEEAEWVDTVISLDPSVNDQLELFVERLAWADHFAYSWEDGKDIMEFDNSNLCHSFLLYSLYFDGSNNNKVLSKYPYVLPTSFPRYTIAEETAKKYLQDSLGRYDNSRLVIEGANVVLDFGDVGSSGVESVDITSAKQTAENEILIEGEIAFHEEWLISRIVAFSITMIENPESIWGGYMLKSIDSWNEAGDFILPEIAVRNYTEEELGSMDAHTLYLARNELYARHGYTFKNQDLQEYFGGKSWYTPRVTEVPDSLFNKYEKANLALIQSLEARF